MVFVIILCHIFFLPMVLGDDHLILRGGGGLALFGNKYSDLENAGNK